MTPRLQVSFNITSISCAVVILSARKMFRISGTISLMLQVSLLKFVHLWVTTVDVKIEILFIFLLSFDSREQAVRKLCWNLDYFFTLLLKNVSDFQRKNSWLLALNFWSLFVVLTTLIMICSQTATCCSFFIWSLLCHLLTIFNRSQLTHITKALLALSEASIASWK